MSSSPASSAPQQPDRPFRPVLPWICLVSFMFMLSCMDRTILGPLLPGVENEFGITHAASTRLLTYMSAGYSVSMFFSCFLASRVRPRILVGGALLLTGLCMIAASAAGSLGLFALCLMGLGVSAAQYFNGGLSTMRSLVTPRQWNLAISIHEIGPNASFVLAPLLAEAGRSLFGWRGAVAGMGWISIVAAILFLLIAKGGEAPSAPVSFRGIRASLKDPRLWLFTWLMGLGIAGEFATFSVLTLHLTDERGIAEETANLLLSLSRTPAPFALLLGSWLCARLGIMKTLRLCLAGYAAGMFLMAMPWLPALFAGMFTQPVITAMIFPPLFSLLAENFPARDQPMLLSLGMPAASFLGVGIMPSLLGLWGDWLGFAAGFIMMGVMVAATLPLIKTGKRP